MPNSMWKEHIKKRILDQKRFNVMSDYLSQIGKMTGSWINKVTATAQKQRQEII